MKKQIVVLVGLSLALVGACGAFTVKGKMGTIRRNGLANSRGAMAKSALPACHIWALYSGRVRHTAANTSPVWSRESPPAIMSPTPWPLAAPFNSPG